MAERAKNTADNPVPVNEEDKGGPQRASSSPGKEVVDGHVNKSAGSDLRSPVSECVDQEPENTHRNQEGHVAAAAVIYQDDILLPASATIGHSDDTSTSLPENVVSDISRAAEGGCNAHCHLKAIRTPSSSVVPQDNRG